MSEAAFADKEISGTGVVLGLILSLLAFMVVTFSTVAYLLAPADRGVLSIPFLRLLSSAFAAVTLLIAVAAYRADRDGWWWYIVAAPFPILNLAIIAGWFTKWNKEAGRFGRWRI